MPSLLNSRKITHPVLLDPTETYAHSLDLRAWPLATLLDRSGHVAWQGETGTTHFANACEQAIEKLIHSDR